MQQTGQPTPQSIEVDQDESSETESSTDEIDEVRYPCPYCLSEIKRKQDLARHLSESCGPDEKWKCPHCSRLFTRRHKLRTHHVQHDCGSDNCSLTDKIATGAAIDRYAMGCGFCIYPVLGNPAQFASHVWDHYKTGKRPDLWKPWVETHSLLAQAHVWEIWSDLWAGLPSTTSKMLVWSTTDEEKLITLLSKRVSVDELKHRLPHFLQRGLLCFEQPWCRTNATNERANDIHRSDRQPPYSASHPDTSITPPDPIINPATYREMTRANRSTWLFATMDDIQPDVSNYAASARNIPGPH